MLVVNSKSAIFEVEITCYTNSLHPFIVDSSANIVNNLEIIYQMFNNYRKIIRVLVFFVQNRLNTQ